MCDTFIGFPGATKDGSVIFAKNSDREANEAQSLEFYPAKQYDQNSTLKCTYITIPQAPQTNKILISRPFWMWGAEMGINEHGVVIGNEAVFTKMPYNSQPSLTGMDLLRLALERTATAGEAKNLIIDMLQKYNQGGICGYRDKSLSYHNSFILADKQQAWVLDTAGIFWAARKIDKYYAISNGLTIEEDFDEIHPEAESYAREKGWINGDRFSFAKAFSDWFYTTFSACKQRGSRANEILADNVNKISVSGAIEHLRDHNSPDYHPASHLLGHTICAHAGNSITRNSSQTTSSMVVHLLSGEKTVWVTASSAPCISAFKPLWFDNEIIPALQETAGSCFSDSSYWWKNEKLHRLIIEDYSHRLPLISAERDSFEKKYLDMVYSKQNHGSDISKAAFTESLALLDKWINRVQNSKIITRPNIFYRKYWKKLNKEACINI